MIAYRAETTMVNIVRQFMSREDDARSFMRSLYQTAGDIVPDEKNGILKVRLHHATNPISDEIVKQLCGILNASKTMFPGTKLQLVYELVSS